MFNLKPPNAYVRYEYFKIESIPMVLDLIQSNDWLEKIDLIDAYFAMNMAPKDRKFLKYQFSSCPFWLGSALRMFTRLLKPVMAMLRRNGVRVVIFLDDMILINHDEVVLKSRGDGLMVAGAIGVCREFREVPDRTGDPDRVSWVLVEHKTDGGEIALGESPGYQTTVPGVIASETDHGESVSQDHSQVDSCSPGNPAWSITLQATADAKNKSFVHWQLVLWVISDSDAGMQSRIGLVGEVHKPVERLNHDKVQSGSGCVDHNRCIQEGMGGLCERIRQHRVYGQGKNSYNISTCWN